MSLAVIPNEERGSQTMIKRLLSFAGLPFLSMATPFLILPILARLAGPDAWIAIAVGQSTGGFFALVVAQGYNLVGPTMVNITPTAERADAFRISVQSRFVVFLPMAIGSFALVWLIAPAGYRLEGALMGVAATVTGLSSAWFMIGLGRPGLIALYEILPKVVATIGAVIPVVVYHSVLWYPLLLIASSFFSLLAFSRRTTTIRALFRFRFREVREALAANRSAMLTEVGGGAYATLTVAFVAASAVPGQSAAYASGDKLYKIGIYAVAAVGNALQGWVVEHGGKAFAGRARQSFVVHFVLGIFGLVSFVAIGPILTEFMFGRVVAIDQATAVGLGIAILALSLNTSLGRHTLLALGARRQVMISVFVGAGVGVPLIIFLSAALGASGGAWGLAASESLVVFVQAGFVYLRRRELRDPPYLAARVEGDLENIPT